MRIKSAGTAETHGRGADGHLEVPIANVYPLEQVREAYTELERRHTRGKIVLRPSENRNARCPRSPQAADSNHAPRRQEVPGQGPDRRERQAGLPRAGPSAYLRDRERQEFDMSDPLDWNAKTIAEFRANEGRVG